MTRTLGVFAGFALAVAMLVPLRAEATGATYNFTAVADLSSQTCGTAINGGVTQTNCFVAWLPSLISNTPLTGPLILNAGDVVNVDVTFLNPVMETVGGSDTQSSMFVALIDGNYGNCQSTPATCTPETSTSTVSLLGYTGPAGISTGPTTTTLNDFYLGSALVNGPNSGFTVTGFDATIDIDSSDPATIPFIAFESQTINTPEPGTNALLLAGFGLLFLMRKRVLRGFTAAV